MLTEAHELRRRGTDVVVGYFEPHGRQETIALIDGLEVIPRRRMDYRGNTFEEMDTEAILNRHPRIALVDEFPHTNVPGSAREKRWEDVDLLLDAGIDVFTTMNVQHLESLNDQIWQSTGIRVRETVPDWVVRQADEVVMVDLTPQALLNRLARGVVYGPERARAALENFFKEPTLVALRELAMRQTAHAIQSRHEVESTRPQRSPAGWRGSLRSASCSCSRRIPQPPPSSAEAVASLTISGRTASPSAWSTAPIWGTWRQRRASTFSATSISREGCTSRRTSSKVTTSPQRRSTSRAGAA